MNDVLQYQSRACTLAAAFLLTIIAAGCGGGDGADEMAPVQLNPDEATAHWRKLMESPGANLENPDLATLAIKLSQSSPEFVDEMIAEFDDPALSGEKMMALVVSLEQTVSPATVPKLVELTAAEKPGQIRGAATYLIGLVQSPEAVAALEALRNDEFGTVRLSALLGLSDRGDEKARAALHEIYLNDETSMVTRERILLSAAKVPEDADRRIYELGIQSSGFGQDTYLRAVSALGRVGTLESIEALNALKANPDSSVGVREMCDNTIAAIEERLGDAAPANAS